MTDAMIILAGIVVLKVMLTFFFISNAYLMLLIGCSFEHNTCDMMKSLCSFYFVYHTTTQVCLSFQCQYSIKSLKTVQLFQIVP